MSAIRNCPFCNLSDRILKESELAVLFLSNPRKTEGHFLVSPKRHVEKPWELTNKEMLDIYELIFLVEKKMLGKFGTGWDIRQNYRPFMQQSRVKVDHIHYHVIPRTNEDNIYRVSEIHDYSLWEELGDKEYDRIAKLLE